MFRLWRLNVSISNITCVIWLFPFLRSTNWCGRPPFPSTPWAHLSTKRKNQIGVLQYKYSFLNRTILTKRLYWLHKRRMRDFQLSNGISYFLSMCEVLLYAGVVYGFGFVQYILVKGHTADQTFIRDGKSSVTFSRFYSFLTLPRTRRSVLEWAVLRSEQSRPQCRLYYQRKRTSFLSRGAYQKPMPRVSQPLDYFSRNFVKRSQAEFNSIYTWFLLSSSLTVLMLDPILNRFGIFCCRFICALFTTAGLVCLCLYGKYPRRVFWAKWGRIWSPTSCNFQTNIWISSFNPCALSDQAVVRLYFPETSGVR